MADPIGQEDDCSWDVFKVALHAQYMYLVTIDEDQRRYGNMMRQQRVVKYRFQCSISPPE